MHTEVGHACIGARVNGRLVPLDSPAAVGRHVRDLHLEGRGRRAEPRLAEDRRTRRGRATRSASGSRVSGATTRIETGREELVKATAPRGPAGAEARRQRRPRQGDRRAMNYADLEALYVAIGEHHVSARSVAQRDGPRASGRRGGGAARQPRLTQPRRTRRAQRNDAGRPRRGPRRRHGAAVALLHPRAGRRDHRLRHPGSGRVGAPGRLRQRRVAVGRAEAARLIDVEWDGDSRQTVFVASIEVKALDRSRLLRDVSNALSDHHVNIVACSTHTGSDRISRMRFDFELADPQPPRLGAAHDQADRQRLRRLSHPARQGEVAPRASSEHAPPAVLCMSTTLDAVCGGVGRSRQPSGPDRGVAVRREVRARLGSVRGASSGAGTCSGLLGWNAAAEAP